MMTSAVIPFPVVPPVIVPQGAVAVKPKLLDQLREVIRLKHYSIRTEESYVGWVRRWGPGRSLGF
jgi:hypothetical protein